MAELGIGEPETL